MSVTDEQVVTGASILVGAREARPVLEAEAAESERRRQLTPAAVDALRATGVFRMPMPRAWGGPEVHPCAQIEIIEELARADGSAGWCAMIGSDGGYFSASLDDASGRALYPDLDAVTAGWVQPVGRLDRVVDGYRLSGRWRFASGCTHADVMLAGALTFDGGEPVLGHDGQPEWRIALLPADQVTIVETWDPTGLAGSGSHDYTTEGTIVPAEHTFRFGEVRREGPLYAWPGSFGWNWHGVPLGIARAALDATEDLLDGKVLVPELRPARDEPRIRAGVARAEAMVGAARSYAFDVIDAFWHALVRDSLPSRRVRAGAAGLVNHTVRTCRAAVALLADTVGTDSTRRGFALERHLRDLQTLSQHFSAQPKFLEVVGALWLPGAELDHPLLRARLV
jgi:alkylation response protein AidB-like acyl-CoA dehydrogenase